MNPDFLRPAHASGRDLVKEPAQPQERYAFSVPHRLPGAAATTTPPASPAAKTSEPAAASPSFSGDLPAPTALLGLGTSAARLFSVPPTKPPQAT